MKFYTEKSLAEFTPWSGAKNTFEVLKMTGKLDALEAVLMELSPHGMGETSLNDLLWFEPEMVAEWVGLDYCDECGFDCECDEDE